MKTKQQKYTFSSDTSKEAAPEGQGGMNTSELELPSLANASEGKDAAPSPGKELHNQPIAIQLVNHLLLKCR